MLARPGSKSCYTMARRIPSTSPVVEQADTFSSKKDSTRPLSLDILKLQLRIFTFKIMTSLINGSRGHFSLLQKLFVLLCRGANLRRRKKSDAKWKSSVSLCRVLGALIAALHSSCVRHCVSLWSLVVGREADGGVGRHWKAEPEWLQWNSRVIRWPRDPLASSKRTHSRLNKLN